MLPKPTRKTKTDCGPRAGVLLVAIAIVVVCLGGCSPEHTSYSDFRDLPDHGWATGAPIYFTPQCGDSTGTYDVTLAVRNTDMYKYDKLILTVDIIDTCGKVMRNRVEYTITDRYGNFQGSGFGVYYQSSALIARRVRPWQMKRIVAWPGMKGCPVIAGLSNIGIIVTPSK